MKKNVLYFRKKKKRKKNLKEKIKKIFYRKLKKNWDKN